MALTEDLPEQCLKRGDIGVVVLVHTLPVYEIEFTTLDGNTLAVVSVHPHQVRAVGKPGYSQWMESIRGTGEFQYSLLRPGFGLESFATSR